jgi:hypothetical protein
MSELGGGDDCMSGVVVDGDSEAVPVVATFGMPWFWMSCGCESAVGYEEELEGELEVELVAQVSSRSPEPLPPINFARACCRAAEQRGDDGS